MGTQVKATEARQGVVRGVELLEVGEDWSTSTGVFTFTAEHLQSIIASQDDPAVRTPVVKLGHVDPRFDGEPALGRVVNLRLENNGMTLVGDLYGLPIWLADNLPTLYPRRSIEGELQYTSQTGNTWPMILTGVALLGSGYPAINTLEDIPLLFDDEVPDLVPADETLEVVATGRRMVRLSGPTESLVKASVEVDDIRRAYYDSLDASQMWWWIRAVRVDPLELIVDDDEGHLYRVPVTVSGEEITFGDAVEVKIEYVAAAAKPGQVLAASYLSPEESGRAKRQVKNAGEAGETSSTDGGREGEEPFMDRDELIQLLGLEADATDETIREALTRLQPASDDAPTVAQVPPAPPAPVAQEDPGDDGDEDSDEVDNSDDEPTSTLQLPDGMTLIDTETLREIQEGAQIARSLQEREEVAARNRQLDEAIRAGKFPKARRAHYEKLLIADPEGTKQLLASLAPGLIPVAERGVESQDDSATVDASYPASWGRTVEAQRRGNTSRIRKVND